MTGHRPFGELTKSITPERRARVAAKAAALSEEMSFMNCARRAVCRKRLSRTHCKCGSRLWRN